MFASIRLECTARRRSRREPLPALPADAVPSWAVDYHRGQRQQDLERRSDADRAGDMHLAAMGIDDRFHDRQSEAEAARMPAAPRIGPREPVEDVIQVGGRDPRPGVADRDDGPGTTAADRHLDRVRFRVWFTAFSIRASSATSRRSASAVTVASSVTSQKPTPRRRRPATNSVDHDRLHVDRLGMEELGVLSSGEEEEAVGEATQAHQLVGDDGGILGERRVFRAPLDQLRMPEGDGDRRPQFVRRVLHEPPLSFEQTQVRHRHTLGLLHGRQAPACMPHHRHEHGSHEGDLGELVE